MTDESFTGSADSGGVRFSRGTDNRPANIVIRGDRLILFCKKLKNHTIFSFYSIEKNQSSFSVHLLIVTD